MNGNKKTIIEKPYFYKEYSENEYNNLKSLHGDNITLEKATIDDLQYIKMPYGNVISIDTIPLNKRNSDCIRNIIIENIPFILEQIRKLNTLEIYYSDCMQWLYYDNKMFLIDMDISYNTKIDYCHNNFDLFINFLNAFNIDSKFISESLYYLFVFQCEGYVLVKEDTELYNKLHNDYISNYNHVYYCKNERHIQIKTENVCIYSNSGNILLTETELTENIINEWELLKIA